MSSSVGSDVNDVISGHSLSGNHDERYLYAADVSSPHHCEDESSIDQYVSLSFARLHRLFPSAGVLKQSAYSKHSSILCSVCACYRSCQLFSTDYCCSPLTKHPNRQVCDSCIHQHVLSRLYSCLTSTVACPELCCSARLSQSAICDILLKYKSHDLLDEYLREQQWEGKSDEWIKRFAARCPGCDIPIEKNGGCDEMICIRCQTHFYWSRAKRHFHEGKNFVYQSVFIIHPSIVGIILLLVLLVFLLTLVVLFRK